MLSDLEMDVLFLVEGSQGFEGAWRLPAPRFALAPHETHYEVAVAMRGSSLGSTYAMLAMMLHGVESGRLMVFDPADGAPTPLRRGIPIKLSPGEREHARARAADRDRKRELALEAARTAPATARRTSGKRFVLLVTKDLEGTRRLDASRALHVQRVTSMGAAANYIDLHPPDLIVVDLGIEGAGEFARHVENQQFPERVVFIGDHCEQLGLGVAPKPLSAATVRELVALSGARMAESDPADSAACCAPQPARCLAAHAGHCMMSVRASEIARSLAVLVVDRVGSLSHQVREAMPWGVRVTRARDGWEAIERVEAQRFDWVLCDETTVEREDAAPRSDVTGARLLQTMVAICPALSGRVLFATTAAHKERMRRERPSVAGTFFAVPFDPAALRARLGS